jgi:hypothetical protein
MASVELIGLGPVLRAPQRGGVGRLSHMDIHANGPQFLGHESPSGAPLQREGP